MSPSSQNRVQCVFAALLAVNMGLALPMVARSLMPARAQKPVEVVQHAQDLPAQTVLRPTAAARHVAAAWTHRVDERDAAE